MTENKQIMRSEDRIHADINLPESKLKQLYYAFDVQNREELYELVSQDNVQANAFAEQLAHLEANEYEKQWSLEQIDLNKVASQYNVYTFINKFKTQDLAKVQDYLTNNPNTIWRQWDVLGNKIFSARIWDYEGRQCVIDFSKDEACRKLKDTNPDVRNQYFYERWWSNAPDSSNNRWVPKLRLFQDANWKAYNNIKANFDKQTHIPEEVRAIVRPYLEQISVITEDKRQQYYNAVGTTILQISNKDPQFQERAMAAWEAIKNFYGDWMTDSEKDGFRLVGYVNDDYAWLDSDQFGFSSYDLALWD